MTAATPTIRPVLPDGQVWPEDAVEVGRVIDAWGVKGGIKVQPFSADPQALFCTKKWFLLPPEEGARAGVAKPARASDAPAVPGKAPARLTAPRFLPMKQVREQGDLVVGTSDELLDRNAAEALKGARVFVSRSAFPTPDSDEFYWVDLIGLDVVNREGQLLGQVVDLIDTGPHCVLRLQGPVAGGQPGETTERLIPFVSAYIGKVSLADRRIEADWGLDY